MLDNNNAMNPNANVPATGATPVELADMPAEEPRLQARNASSEVDDAQKSEDLTKTHNVESGPSTLEGERSTAQAGDAASQSVSDSNSRLETGPAEDQLMAHPIAIMDREIKTEEDKAGNPIVDNAIPNYKRVKVSETDTSPQPTQISAPPTNAEPSSQVA